MPAFVWKGKTRDGKAVSGERNAENKEAVMALLRRDQILVSSVKEKGKELALPKFGGGVPSDLPMRLAAAQVHVSVRGQAMRVTPHVWNTDDDVEKLFSVLKTALA